MFNLIYLLFWLSLLMGLIVLLIASLEIWPLRRLWKKQKAEDQIVVRFVPD